MHPVHTTREGHTFGHGTGHGVGAYLNVHEGPQGLSQRPRPYKGGFVAGMTQSNEVRSEAQETNLVVVRTAQDPRP